RKPRRELCFVGICVKLVEMYIPRCFCNSSAQQYANGLLSTCTNRYRCSETRCRGSTSGHQLFNMEQSSGRKSRRVLCYSFRISTNQGSTGRRNGQISAIPEKGRL